MSQREVELVQQSAERWNALLAEEDLESLRELVAEQYDPGADVDWSATNPDMSPAEGIDAVLGWVESVLESMQELRFEPLNVIQVAEALVTYMRVTGQARSSGLSASMEYAIVNRFKDGKIVLSHTYQTLPEALEAAWSGG